MATPGLHPTQQTRATESQAEHRVYEALATGLPKGWYAWHCLRVDADWAEGEGDFVIINPERAMAGGGVDAEPQRIRELRRQSEAAHKPSPQANCQCEMVRGWR